MTKDQKNLLFYIVGGNLEILKSLEKSKSPLQFKHLRELINPKTNKKFSSSTIAQSLKDLEDKGAIQNEIIKDKKKKKALGYALTENGKKTLMILKETEEKLEKIH